MLQPESPVPVDELEQVPLVPLQPDSAASQSENSDNVCKPRTLSISFSSLLITSENRRLGGAQQQSENQMHQLTRVASDSCLRTAKHARTVEDSDRCQTEARSLFKFDKTQKRQTYLLEPC
jgi:hypothetical protein